MSHMENWDQTKTIDWIPAYAGMTEGLDSREACARESGYGNDD